MTLVTAGPGWTQDRPFGEGTMAMTVYAAKEGKLNVQHQKGVNILLCR